MIFVLWVTLLTLLLIDALVLRIQRTIPRVVTVTQAISRILPVDVMLAVQVVPPVQGQLLSAPRARILMQI